MSSWILSFLKSSLPLGLIPIFSVFTCSKLPWQKTVTQTPYQIPTVSQGITGKVLFKEGNFSSTGDSLQEGRQYVVERKILVYELTSLKDVEIDGGDFVSTVTTRLLDSTSSDRHGNFALALNQGVYSLFIDEGGRLYSKLGDDQTYLRTEIDSGKTQNVVIEIDYKANY